MWGRENELHGLPSLKEQNDGALCVVFDNYYSQKFVASVWALNGHMLQCPMKSFQEFCT